MKNSNAPAVKREAEEDWAGHINERNFPHLVELELPPSGDAPAVAVHMPTFSVRSYLLISDCHIVGIATQLMRDVVYFCCTSLICRPTTVAG
jgi:hypothetical protein